MAEICTGENYTQLIDRTECIGNSLAKINSNFRSLDLEVCSLGNNIETLNTSLSSLSANVPTIVENLSIPSGAVVSFARPTAPSGWLICNGASLNTTTYSRLFGAIGYTFGGSGASFNVPDLRGRFIRGQGGNSAGFGGAQTDAMQNITGRFSLRGTEGADNVSGAFANLGSTGSAGAGHNPAAWNPLIDFNAARVVRTAGETRPVNLTLIYCIKI